MLGAAHQLTQQHWPRSWLLVQLPRMSGDLDGLLESAASTASLHGEAVPTAALLTRCCDLPGSCHKNLMGSVQFLSTYRESSLTNILTFEGIRVGREVDCQRSLFGSCETPLPHLCLLLARLSGDAVPALLMRWQSRLLPAGLTGISATPCNLPAKQCDTHGVSGVGQKVGCTALHL